MKIAPINVTQYSNTQKRNNNKINNSNQPNFKGLVKLTDFNGQSIVMDAKKILGAIDTPLTIKFHTGPSQFYRDVLQTSRMFIEAYFKGISITYDDIYPQKYIDRIEFQKQRDFLDSRVVRMLAIPLDDFTAFWQKALSSKTTMELKSGVDNEFLKAIRDNVPGADYIGPFWGTSMEQDMRKTPGFIKTSTLDTNIQYKEYDE